MTALNLREKRVQCETIQSVTSDAPGCPVMAKQDIRFLFIWGDSFHLSLLASMAALYLERLLEENVHSCILKHPNAARSKSVSSTSTMHMGLPTPSLNQDAFVKISRQLPEEDTMRPHTSLCPGSEACALDYISWLPALHHRWNSFRERHDERRPPHCARESLTDWMDVECQQHDSNLASKASWHQRALRHLLLMTKCDPDVDRESRTRQSASDVFRSSNLRTPMR